MNEELKPCPFCGRDCSVHIDKYQCNGEWWHFAECEECMAKGPVGKTEQDAADAWNERASQPMPPHVISEIEKAAKKIHDCVEVCNMCVTYGKCGLIGIDHEDCQCRTAIAKALARAAGWSV
ncbi:MAG: Lar family restriction alleviation protein [Schwartzia sp.]|nr:Lar family restriction alleviation protein [Schwartzia sp. (in: firmicutes)]